MRIATVTMVGQFPHGIDLHVRNLRWALSEGDHIYIVTTGSIIRDFHLESDDRVTYISFGECNDIRTFLPFWKRFPRIVREHGIDPQWFLFMEQDIWFYQRIKDDVLPDAKEIRSHVPPNTHYHCVLVDEQVYHPRVWEGSTLIHGPLVRRAIDFGVDFSAHEDWFIKKDREHWERPLGGKLSLAEYDAPDTMDEFTLYCALAEGTRITQCPRAVHLQGPEALHRNNPRLYRPCDEQLLQLISEQWSYFCVRAAVAVYFIAGNWKTEADWKRIRPRSKPRFEKLLPTAKEWMKPEEYERLRKIVSGLK
jgi:hypothetical protein